MSISRAPRVGRLLTAMVTPFDRGDHVDLREAARLARFLIAQGNDGLVVSGTTGESPALEDEEKLDLFRACKEAIGPSGSVVAGTGGNNTRRSVEFSKAAEACGADAILAVVPYYNKPTQDGMLRHFGAIAEGTSLPVIVYNVPSRTSANMLPATLIELAKRHENIAGVKESSGDFAQFSAILRDRPAGFGFWCGDDNLFLPSLAVGGDGLVGVASHLCARELREMLDAYVAGDVTRAAAIHLELSELFAALFATTSPIPVKWALNELGFACGSCRSPLGTLPAALEERLRPLLAPYRERVRAAGLAAVS
jgi:4-hydroxy-tetrahydrodipicolinate synthase